MNIKTKILIPAIALTLLVAAAILVSNIVLFSRFVDKSTVARVNSASTAAASSLNSLKAVAKAVSLSIAENRHIIRGLKTNDRAGLFSQALKLQAETGIDFCTITDREGNVILRTHEPGRYGDSITFQANIRAALLGNTMSLVEQGSAVLLSVRAGTPVYDDDDGLLGVVSVGFRLDTENFVDSVKEMSGCETTVLLGDQRIATTVLTGDQSRALGTKAEARVSSVVLAGNSYTGKVDLLGREAEAVYTPVMAPDNHVLGMLFVGLYADETNKTIAAFVHSGLIIAFIMLVIFITVVLFMVNRIVTRIQAMTRAASSLAMGDTDIDIQVNTRDEVRTLADAFNRMIGNTKHQVRIIEDIAGGGLTVPLQPRSEKDVMNRALEKLNTTIKAQAEAIAADHGRLETALAGAKEATNAKSNFLAHMSHEIRTPLNAVIGFSELILGSGSLNREAELNLEKVYNAGSTILSIVNNILDISKIESGKLELCPVQYDTPSLVNDVVTLNIMRIGEKPIIFKLYVDENLPGALCGDDLRVRQVFSNLLSNAFKYTNSGAVEWRVSFERNNDDLWLVSSIRDTGIGINPGDRKNLFADYHQVDAKINRKVEGTGLGLAITKRLVEMMNGTISVESEYGKGSLFSVRLRQALVSETPIGAEVAKNLMNMNYTLSKRKKNTKLPRIDLSYARLLVVDDVETNLDVAKGLMRPYGIKIDSAASGQEAVDIIRRGIPRYNAVFMDHMMPGMDGIEAARIIRKEIGTDYARNIPVIALTANAIVGNEEMFLAKGFQDFISKPIDMAKLDGILQRWVRDKNQEKSFTLPPDVPQPNVTGTNTALFRNLDIKGMELKKALERFDGDEAAFSGILRSYTANTPALLARMGQYLDAGNLTDYAVVVHGIKGASYGIFAWETGRAAEDLERAAKAGNLDAVKAGQAVFEKILSALIDSINDVLIMINGLENKPLAAAPDSAVLDELREACKTFNMDKADRAMAELESFRYEQGAGLVAWLREQINNMTFEEISGGQWPSE